MPETNSAEPVGKVIVISGSATAQSSAGERPLSLGSPVFKNDVIKTDVGSKVQIKFADNTQVSQDESSTLAIDNFVYNPDPADNSDLLLNMMKGTFRTISGEIVKDSPTNFMLKSPQGTIGIRGTIVVSHVTDLYEKHGVEELTPGKILVITDNFGNIRIFKVPMKIVDFYKGKPVSEVRDLLLKELDEFQEKSPLDTDEETPLGYTPPDDFIDALGQDVDILGADIVPSDFGLFGNMLLFSGEGMGLLGVFDSVNDIPGYDPDNDYYELGSSFSVVATDVIQNEGDIEDTTDLTFTITRDGDISEGASVDWTVTGSGSNPADAGDFGGAFPTGTAVFGAGQATVQVTITVMGDSILEADETFQIILSNPTGNTTIAAPSAEGTIINDDIIPLYSIAATGASQNEGDTEGTTNLTFTIIRSGDLTEGSSVDWTVSGTGDITDVDANADDFGGAFPTDTVVFEAGQESVVVTVSVSGDNDFEPWENFSITLSNPSNDGVIVTASATAIGTIENDDFYVEPSDLDGDNGFVIQGFTPNTLSPLDVSNAGDINSDGVDDFIIGDAGANSYAGQSYVVFGGPSFGNPVDVSDLGTAGLTINGEQGSGYSVSNAGDVNGDGIDDLIIGAPFGDGDGISYVVFGGQDWNTWNNEIDLSNLGAPPDDGGTYPDGFTIYGNYQSGYSVSNAGDVDGDGVDDLIVGSGGGDGGGTSYVVFGGQNWSNWNNSINLNALGNGDGGADGFTINDWNGSVSSLSNAGDLNGDGFDDLIFGASYAYGSEGSAAYVVFGGQDWTTWDNEVNLSSLGAPPIDGVTFPEGFTITGVSGQAVVGNAGDIDNDGFEDIIIGDDSNAYVLFGSNVWDPEFNLPNMNEPDGLTITGVDGYVSSVNNAGDFNGDGFADIIIGTSGGDSGGNAYVIFGQTAWEDSTIDLFQLGPNGFIIDSPFDTVSSVSNAGDINGDGFDDLILGASYFGDGSYSEAYVIFGNDYTGTADQDFSGYDLLYGSSGSDNLVTGNALFWVDGGAGFDTLTLEGLTIDLTGISNNNIDDIERIDLIAGAEGPSSDLILDISDVLDMTNTANELFIDGGDDDSVTVSGGEWTTTGFVDEGGYQTYTSGDAILHIDTDINLSITATQMVFDQVIA